MKVIRRRVLVTGACGGLGSRVTDLLASRGITVFAADVDEGALGRLGRPPLVIPVRMDVRKQESVAAAQAKVADMTDGLDGLVNCAGIFLGGPLVEAHEEDLARILDINVTGVFRVVKEFFPILRRRAATIVIVSSESVRCAMPLAGPYTMSKCALEAYSDSLRRELMFLGVRVAVIQPGAIRTALLRDARDDFARAMPGSLFAGVLRRAQQVLEKEWHTGMPAERVARVVVHVLESRAPRPRYRVGNDPLRALLGRLPAGCADALIRRFL